MGRVAKWTMSTLLLAYAGMTLKSEIHRIFMVASPSLQPSQLPGNSRSEDVTSTTTSSGRLQCRMVPAPRMGQDPVELPGLVLPVKHQCGGDLYTQFTELMQEWIRQDQYHAESWGRRDSILPVSSTSGGSILILVNSPTMQQFISILLCQYQPWIVKTKMLPYKTTNKKDATNNDKEGILKITFRHNVTLYAALDHPLVTTKSPKWQSILQDSTLKQKNTPFKAIVMGASQYDDNNHYDKHATNVTTTSVITTKRRPTWDLDWKEVAKTYPGPIIIVSSLAKSQQQKQHQHQQPLRSNIRHLDARKHVRALEQLQGQLRLYNTKFPPLHECSVSVSSSIGSKRIKGQDGQNNNMVSTCNINVLDEQFSGEHKCIGNMGGHVDLLVWDVLEALHELVGA